VLVFNGTFSINGPYRAIGILNIYCVGSGGTHSNIDKLNEKTNTLFHLGFVEIVEIISSPHEGVIRGVFYSQSLGKY